LSRVPLEAAVIKLSRAGSIASLESILDKVDGLVKSTPVTDRSAERYTKPVMSTPGVDMVKPKPPETAIVAPRAESSTDLDEMLSAWSSVINYIMPKKISIAHYLQEGYPVAIEGKTVVIGFPKELRFHKEVLEATDNRKMVEEAVRAKLNLDVKIEFRLEESKVKVNPSGPSGANSDGDGEDDLDGVVQSDSDPIVNAAIEMFGGEVSPRERMKKKPQ
ncbi:MAG: hypothetical protein WCK38_01385, partial [Candidatus Omnitrophota bacterium]